MNAQFIGKQAMNKTIETGRWNRDITWQGEAGSDALLENKIRLQNES